MIAVVLAALFAGRAILSSAADASETSRRSGVAIAGVTLVAAVVIAGFETVGSATLAADGLALLAAGLFPALVLALYWRGMTGAGAIAAMLAGSAITLVYLAGVHIWPVELFSLTGSLSDATPQAAQHFRELHAALQAAATPEAHATAYAALLKHTIPIANWIGLKPAAIILVSLPAGVIAGIAVSMLGLGKKTDRP
jgi:cation/acetate symporter